MPFNIRAFEASDLAALRALHEQSQTEPTVDRAATQEEDAPGEETLQRFVADEGSGPVGYGYVARSSWHPEGWFQGEVVVLPAARRQGVGSALTSRVVSQAKDLGGVQLTAWVNGRVSEFEHFALRRGFEEVQRFVTMTLDVSKADEGQLAQWVAQAQEQGVSLFSFEETGRTHEARQKLYELNRRLAPLLPGNGDEFPTFEEYEREIIEAEWFRPEGQLIAAQGEHWVGLVGLGFYEEGRRLDHEFTALDPAYQGRGLALALKAWSVQQAKAWGVQEIRTGNDASNTAIISLNQRLGYVLQPGGVKLRRTLGAPR